MRQIPENAMTPQAGEPPTLSPTTIHESRTSPDVRADLVAHLARAHQPMADLGMGAAAALQPIIRQAHQVAGQVARAHQPMADLGMGAAAALQPIIRQAHQGFQGLLHPYQGLMGQFEGLIPAIIPPDLLTSIQRATVRLADQMAWVAECLQGWQEQPEAVIARATASLEEGDDRPLRDVLGLLNLPESDAIHLAYVLFDDGRYGVRPEGAALWWTAKNPVAYLRRAVFRTRSRQRTLKPFILGSGEAESIEALGIECAVDSPAEPEWIMGFGRRANELLERIRADLGAEGWRLYLAIEQEGATRTARTARAFGWTEKKLESTWKRMSRVLKKHNAPRH